MKIIPTAQMSKTTRELSGYAIPRPAAGVMRGALRRRRWEPAGWAGIWRLGTSGLGGARPGEGGQEGGALPLGKTQHGAFPGRQRTGRCPRRCAWHGEGTRAQPVPSHAGLAPQVTLTRKQYPPPQGWPGVEEVAGRGPKRKAGGQEVRDDPEGDHEWSGGGWGRAKPPSRAGGRAQAAHTHLPLPLPARPPGGGSDPPRAARAGAHAHTHTRAPTASPRARARPAQPQLRSFKAGRALRRSRRGRRAAAMAAPSAKKPLPTPGSGSAQVPPYSSLRPRLPTQIPPYSPPWSRLQGGARCCLRALSFAPRPRSLLAQ